MSERRKASRLARLVEVAAVVFVAAFLVHAFFPGTVSGFVERLAFACLLLLGFAWLFRVVWRRFFWGVGRRLAFSYLLLGVLPIFLLAILAALATYLLGGFLLGHHYRDSIGALRDELEDAATATLVDGPASARARFSTGTLRVVEYRRGRRVDDSTEAPVAWPGWLEAASVHAAGEPRPYVALADGRLTIAAAVRDGDRGAVVWLDGDLDALLRARTRSWLQLFRSDDPRELETTRIQVGDRRIVLRGLWLARKAEETAEFYRLDPPRGEKPRLWEKPVVLWMETSLAPRALADGHVVAESVAASLAASPRGLARALLSSSEGADSAAWLALAGVGVLLLEIYAVAAGLAVFMIYGLSHTVNRLSKATAAVAAGDFSVRMPVRRKDQLGELQRSFNEMAEHLSELVQTAAQKEALDKELALARRVQQDLLPAAIQTHAGVEIATHFEPSAAIGGDYYDVLPSRGARGGPELAVIVADVAGHGLAAGLRMAMVKSALTLLIEDEMQPEQVFARLHRLLKSRPGERSFVTATLGIFDAASGRLELTNAGHPPTYLVRAQGDVEEIALPGSPLGTLGGAPGQAEVRLAPGDAAVWLSDGLIEARAPDGELFGYERVRRCLVGPPTAAYAVRDRLLAATRAHTGGAPVEDDRTVVVLVYRPNTSPSPKSA